MKVLRILLIIIIIIFSLISLVVITLAINHQVKLNKESNLYQPMGQMVDVSDKKMHVYIEGEGEETFVFLAGHGTSSPTLDFKPLWKKLSEQHKIVIVEKFGYGFSDVSNQDKDIDTILEDTRKALLEMELSGPFVLVPHSFSGLEAIYWAQKYPEEVKAIIGLDACTPEAIELLPIPSKTQLNLVYFISRIGLSRIMPQESLVQTLPLLESNDLTDDEKLVYKSLFFRSSLTKDMLRELSRINENAEQVLSLDKPIDTPMYFFISSKQNDDIPGWAEALSNYLEAVSINNTMTLDTSHYVHHEMSNEIYLEIIDFLKII